jgi:hypothetical protein
MNHMGHDMDVGFFPINQFSIKPDFSFAEQGTLLNEGGKEAPL